MIRLRFKKGLSVGGILYLHDISSNYFSQRKLDETLGLFSALCDRHPMYQVAFVTTKWDKLWNLNEGRTQVKELLEDSWRSYLLKHEAHVYHLQPSPDNRRTSDHSREVLLSTPLYSDPWDIIQKLIISADIRILGRPKIEVKEWKSFLDRLTKDISRKFIRREVVVTRDATIPQPEKRDLAIL